MPAQARGNIAIDIDECKGCGLCVESCPPKCLELTPDLSAYGVHPARYKGDGCTGCGICFYCCLLLGQLLTEMGMREGLDVSWIPTY